MRGNRAMRRLRGWCCHSVTGKTMGFYPRSPELMQRQKMVSLK